MNCLPIENKKIKLKKLHLFILVIFICLVIYFMVLTNQTDIPINLGNINNIDPTAGNSGIGGGGQNPTPGPEASVLGHNSDQGSNFQRENQTFKDPEYQGNMASEQQNIQDNMVAEQHRAQDNIVAGQHTAQDNMVAEQHTTQNQDVWGQHGEESWVEDLLNSAANTRTPSKKIKSFRKCRYADRERTGYYKSQKK